MDVVLIDHPDLSEYRFPGGHPLKPERYTLAIALMRDWGLLRSSDDVSGITDNTAVVKAPRPATLDDLALIHELDYIKAVERVDELGPSERLRYGLGPGDTPAFAGMFEAATTVVGASIAAVDAVVTGATRRAYNPAGGLHHAQRDHAAGFCVFNDAAVAIGGAIAQHPGLRVAYIDIDAHHGDGVEAAFASDPRVFTISVHESGRFLFPGTGMADDVGIGAGEGYALNVPLLPHAGPESYAAVIDELITPAIERFSPDVLVAQLGADSHRNDPLTHLENSVASFDAAVERLVALADRACEGRMVALGGGGYDTFSAVPRMWACAMSRLLGGPPPNELPRQWISEARRVATEAGHDWQPLERTFDEHLGDMPEPIRQELSRETETVILRLRNTHPIFTRTA